jgi:arylsulfatase A-like enzyme
MACSLWSLVALLVLPQRLETRPPPNVVVILADDLGWADLGCQGSRYYETPAIDRFAADGMQFTAAYANGPNCAPTRASLLTGRYGPRHGIFTVGTGARGRTEHRSGDLERIEFFEGGRLELFDVAADPGERHDLADEEPETAARLAAALRGGRERLAAPMPAPVERR